MSFSARKQFCRQWNDIAGDFTSLQLCSSFIRSIHRSSFRYSRRQQKKREEAEKKRKEEEKNKVWIIHLIWNLSSYFDFSPLLLPRFFVAFASSPFLFSPSFFFIFFSSIVSFSTILLLLIHNTQQFYFSLCFLVRRFIGGLRSNVSFGCVSHAFDFFSAFGFWSSSSFLFATLPPSSSRCLLAIERANERRTHFFVRLSVPSPYTIFKAWKPVSAEGRNVLKIFFLLFSLAFFFYSFHIQARFQAIFISYTLRFSMKWAVRWRSSIYII